MNPIQSQSLNVFQSLYEVQHELCDQILDRLDPRSLLVFSQTCKQNRTFIISNEKCSRFLFVHRILKHVVDTIWEIQKEDWISMAAQPLVRAQAKVNLEWALKTARRTTRYEKRAEALLHIASTQITRNRKAAEEILQQAFETCNNWGAPEFIIDLIQLQAKLNLTQALTNAKSMKDRWRGARALTKVALVQSLTNESEAKTILQIARSQASSNENILKAINDAEALIDKKQDLNSILEIQGIEKESRPRDCYHDPFIAGAQALANRNLKAGKRKLEAFKKEVLSLDRSRFEEDVLALMAIAKLEMKINPDRVKSTVKSSLKNLTKAGFYRSTTLSALASQIIESEIPCDYQDALDFCKLNVASRECKIFQKYFHRVFTNSV
jgi:hypothetical protein